MHETVEPPFRAKRIEQALEILMLLQQRGYGRPDPAKLSEHRMTAAPQGQDERDLADQELFEPLVLDECAGLRVIEAEALAQHAPDLDRKRLVARVIVEKALRPRQQVDDDDVAALIVVDQPRHQPAQRG